MPIIDERYTATIEVKVPCLVHCLNCDCRFVYERSFSGSGVAHTSWPNDQKRTRRAAEEAARRDLAEMLADVNICDPVPCPQCFHYQPYMFSQVGYGAYDSMGCLCYSLEFLGPLVVAGAIVYAAIAGLSALAIGLATGGVVVFLIGLLIQRRMDWLVTQYNPNAERPLAERKHVAAARAILPADFDARQAERVDRAYEQHRMTADPAHHPLVVEWWLSPSVFINGGVVEIPGANRGAVTVVVPEDAEPGTVFDLRLYPHGVTLFKVRALAMRVHPDELRLE